MAQRTEKKSITGESVEQSSPMPVGQVTTEVDPLHERIALSAYLRAEARGFAPGYEMDDWYQAEQVLRPDASAEN